MVYLSKIYTKTGDDGQTSLGNGDRVPKDDARIEAYGTVDELNAVLGTLLAYHPEMEQADFLRSISNDLFDLGADLCVPRPNENADDAPKQALRVTPHQVDRLEKAIDQINEPLEPLTSFVLPGGSPAAGWCHMARTVCRRAERRVVHLARLESINPLVTIYLNRLSDLLFVLARALNHSASGDVLWQPGQSQSADA